MAKADKSKVVERKPDKKAKTKKAASVQVSYFGCRVHQRSGIKPAMFAFVARVSEIAAWAGIRRVEDSRKGTQRIHRPSRSRAITRFLEANESNTIPNNLLLAFLPGVAAFVPIDLNACAAGEDLENRCEDRMDWGVLSFNYTPNAPEPVRPALVVDGQHRLKGIEAYDEDDLPVFAIALLDANVEEQAFQFIVINNKSVRVPSDNVKAIIANMNEGQVRDRLLKAGVSYGKMTPVLKDADTLKGSPFNGLLEWPNNDEESRIIPVTAIEQMLRYISTAFATLFEADDDSPLEILFTIWNALSSQYEGLWGVQETDEEGDEDDEDDDSDGTTASGRFMSKVNLTALNEFVIDRLKILWETGYLDLFDDDDVGEKVEDMASRLPIEFWNARWVKLADNSAFKNLVKSDLAKLTENVVRKQLWHDGLKVLREEVPESE